MRTNLMRMLKIFSLIMFFQMGFLGCSSQQQAEENLEVSENLVEGNMEGAEGGENEFANEEMSNEEGLEGENELGEGNEFANEGFEGENLEENVLAEENLGGDLGVEGENVVDNSDLESVVDELAAEGTDGAELEGGNALAEAMPEEAIAEESIPVEEAAPAELPGQIAAPAMASSLPEPGTKMPYIVQPGDTLGDIAQKIYGDRKMWSEISQLSNLANPNRIYAGDVVYYQLSEKTQTFAQANESKQRMEATVNPGDTLVTIAQRVLGSAKFWKPIWKENHNIVNPDKLEVGSTIYFVSPAATQASLEKAQAAKVAVNTTTTQSVDLDAEMNISIDAEFVGNFASTIDLSVVRS